MTINFTYDPSTSVGMVRLSLQDTDFTAPGASAPDYSGRATWTVVFSDEEIAAQLTRYSGNINLAVASCLRTLATSKVLLAQYQKFILDDVTVDLGQIAIQLLRMAESLEHREDETAEPFIVVGGPDESVFDLAERRWSESID